LENIVLDCERDEWTEVIVRRISKETREIESNERCAKEMEGDVVVCDASTMRGRDTASYTFITLLRWAMLQPGRCTKISQSRHRSNIANVAGREYQHMVLLSIVNAEGSRDVAIWAE
jgi:hypothetical protein